MGGGFFIVVNCLIGVGVIWMFFRVDYVWFFFDNIGKLFVVDILIGVIWIFFFNRINKEKIWICNFVFRIFINVLFFFLK